MADPARDRHRLLPMTGITAGAPTHPAAAATPHHRLQHSLHTVRCFLSTPFAVLTFILVTAFFFYLMWHPIMNGHLRVVHAMETKGVSSRERNSREGVREE